MSRNPVRKFDLGDLETTSPFYGREKELEDLQQSISSGSRLIALLGMEGIGKTFLAVKLANNIQGEFDYVIGRSLKDFSSLNELLGFLLQLLSDQATKESDSVGIKIARLKAHLTNNRCLLLLKNAEKILQDRELVGKYRQEYKDYDNLLDVFVFTAAIKSHLVLISCKEPESIRKLQNKSLKVKSFLVGGLDYLAAKEIFRVKGLTGSEQRLTQLIDYYQGNPLMLKIVASLIQKICNGDVAQFLEAYTRVFNDIYQILNAQFELLSDLEKEIIYYLSITETPISYKELKKECKKLGVTDAINSLIQCGLIENRKNGMNNEVIYFLKPIVMEFINRKIQLGV